MKRDNVRLLGPILFGFFVMGFGDIIGTVMNQVTEECAAHADAIRFWMPIFAYGWFLLISLPTGVLCGRIGRKRTVLLSLAVTTVAMAVPLAASAERWWLYVVAFALVGIGNTIIQAALPALMSNVVAPDQFTSRLSLGQFVKAVCAALTPVFVYLTATALGDWKLLFPLYGLLTVACAVGLLVARLPDERRVEASGTDAAQGTGRTSLASCLALLKDTSVAAMTVGIFFSVGADVGFSIAIPEYLKNVYQVDKDLAGMGPTVYFVAKTLAAFAGAILFAKVSAATCFPYFMGLGVLLTLAILVAPGAAAFLVLVFAVALLTANSFGMCMGLAMNRAPAKANEISALMVMAIVGGGIVSALFAPARRAFGPAGLVGVLALCLAYLFALGVFARVDAHTEKRRHGEK